MRYLVLQEASDEVDKLKQIKTELRRKLNTCKLARFKSEADCSDFYSVFFCNSLPSSFELTAREWFTLYDDILAEPNFFKNLLYYIAEWKPREYSMLFRGLKNLIELELGEMKQNRVVYLTEMSNSMRHLYIKMDEIRTILDKKLVQPELMKFARMVSLVSEQYYKELNAMMQKELSEEETNKADGLVKFVRPNDFIITENCQEVLDCFETLTEMLSEDDDDLDEGIVSQSKDAVNAAVIKKRKVEDYCDRTLFKAFDNWRKNKERKNHEEMMGETLRISSALKKAFAMFVSWAIFGKWYAPIITGLVSMAIDKQTSKTDRIKIMNDVKDELEIVDEKIQIADRKGDDKAKIEMMRIRQRLRREYERISRGLVLEKS